MIEPSPPAGIEPASRPARVGLSITDGHLAFQPDVVYLAPSGRRCRLYVSGAKPQVDQVTFIYDLRDGSPRAQHEGSEGFVLARNGWYLMRQA